MGKTRLSVYYGYTKLTKKAIREPELAIYFEDSYSYKNEEWLLRRMKIVHTRLQTKNEEKDSLHSNRMFTKYGSMINKKPFNGNIDLVLERNFLADKNHVSKKERVLIREKLRKAYYEFYNVEKKPTGQQALIFD